MKSAERTYLVDGKVEVNMLRDLRPKLDERVSNIKASTDDAEYDGYDCQNRNSL
jgi:hypothetical protein